MFEFIPVNQWNKLPYTLFADIKVEILTENTIKNHQIYLFFRLQKGRVLPLPLRNYTTQSFVADVDALIRPTTIRLIWSFTDAPADMILPPLDLLVFAIDMDYRHQHTDLNFRNYEELKEKFGLPDE